MKLAISTILLLQVIFGYARNQGNNEDDEVNAFLKSRSKRFLGADEYEFQEPAQTNENTSYIELAIVVDTTLFEKYGRNEQETEKAIQNVVQMANWVLLPLNVFLVLVDIVIWKERDEINISSNAVQTLSDFLSYRKNVLLTKQPNDHAQLLTHRDFDDDDFGRTKLGAMCTTDGSGALMLVRHLRATALLMAQLIGHSFGLGFDEEAPGCACPSGNCVMAEHSTYSTKTMHWSTCSLKDFRTALERKVNTCLLNKPRRVFGAPYCGNNIVEGDERCDCGLPFLCENSCCDAETCQLHENKTCGAGQCCDLETCTFKSANTMCRGARNECDLPEFCSGNDESCAENVFKQDLLPCDDKAGFCLGGKCGSHRLGCQYLWGKNSSSDYTACYHKHNKINVVLANCGYDRSGGNLTACEKGSELCGTLQCQTTSKDIIVGTKYTRRVMSSYHNDEGVNIECRGVMVNLGLNNDPGLTPNGAICGVQKICLYQKCVSLEKLQNMGIGKPCRRNCSGHGVCNSRGNCHCDVGFNGEMCQLLGGPGGSVDSRRVKQHKSQLDRFVLICSIIAFCVFAAMLSIWSYRHHLATKARKTSNNVRPLCDRQAEEINLTQL